MWTLLFVGCDQLPIDGEAERVRGALWFEPVYANLPTFAVAAIANSPLPCEPEETPPDPTTDVDEVASAEAWWAGQLGSAATREGAALVILWFPDGANAETITTPLASGQGPGGLTWRVLEAELSDRVGAISTWTPTEWEQVEDATGEATVVADQDSVGIEFTLGAWSGDVAAERCDATEIAGGLMGLVAP